MLLEKIKEILGTKEDLVDKIKKIRDNNDFMNSNIDDKDNLEKKKRHRRTAEDVSRQFKCPVTKCEKCYGSPGAVNQHIKQKHAMYWKQFHESKAKSNIIGIYNTESFNESPVK